MKLTSAQRLAVRAVFDGTYTPLDVREFVQLCYILALPLVRSKIVCGKLNLDILGLKEIDVVYDCLAQLFRRDREGSFVQVKSFFMKQNIDPAICPDDEMLIALRRLVFGKVRQSIVRLYSEVDPVLGKILRNLQLELEGNKSLELQVRFGETCIVPRVINPNYHLPPVTGEFLRQRFSQLVSVRDSIPVMVGKLSRMLLSQEEYQRAVPLVTAALLLKEVYTLGWEAEEKETRSVEPQTEQSDIRWIADDVCRRLAASGRETYVGTRKRTEETFQKYMDAVKEILLGEYSASASNSISYYEHLKVFMPDLTKTTYSRQHRSVLEYLVKQAKRQMKQELKRLSSAGK